VVKILVSHLRAPDGGVNPNPSGQATPRSRRPSLQASPGQPLP
jgi:hypothetical protein